MAGEIREVGAPEVVAPAEGQARLAALTPEERSIAPDGQERSTQRTGFPSREEADRAREAHNAKMVADAEGGEADLATGEYKAPTRPHQPQAAQDAPVDSVPELMVSPALRGDAAAYRQDVANIASDYPALADEASTLFQFIGTAEARDYDIDARDGVLVNGQTPGATLWNESQCRAILSHRYGQSMADGIIKDAAKNWATLPDGVKRWLDADIGNGARLGNNPNVVVGLALRAYAQMSPERARAELVQRRSGEKYGEGGALEKDILHILGIIAARGQQPQPQAFSTSGRDVPAGQGTAESQALRIELAKLNAKDSDLWSSDAQKRKRAVARRAEIHAQLVAQEGR